MVHKASRHRLVIDWITRLWVPAFAGTTREKS